MQEENKLASKYQAIIASAQIEFDGETYTLAALEVKTMIKIEILVNVQCKPIGDGMTNMLKKSVKFMIN